MTLHLWQAVAVRHVHPFRPPPLPDPKCASDLYRHIKLFYLPWLVALLLSSADRYSIWMQWCAACVIVALGSAWVTLNESQLGTGGIVSFVEGHMVMHKSCGAVVGLVDGYLPFHVVVQQLALNCGALANLFSGLLGM